MNNQTKTCTKCKEVKELSEFYKRGKYYISACKTCTKKSVATYQRNNAERIKMRKAIYRKNNIDKTREYDKKYYDNNKDKCKLSHIEWVRDNPEKMAEYKRKWKRLHPETNRKHNRIRRALQANVKEHYTQLDEQYTRELFQHKCACCGSTERLCIDHHYPLSKGHALTRENAVVLCRSCNSNKHTKLPEDFYSPDILQYIEEKLRSGDVGHKIGENPRHTT